MIFRLNSDIPLFPDAELAESDPNGLLAVDGLLSNDFLLAAYKKGIFPWYSQTDPILWWSPDPRWAIPMDGFHLSRRLRQFINNCDYTITADCAFEEVVKACSRDTSPDNEIWIHPEMALAYQALHEINYAHSIEIWRDNTLVGGVYGPALGGVFFGESMFSKEANTSKIALLAACKILPVLGYHTLDCQFHTPHLESLGAIPIRRKTFTSRIKPSIKDPQHWSSSFPGFRASTLLTV